MEQSGASPAGRWKQHGIFLGLSAFAVALVAALYLLNDRSFRPYFGSADPLAVIGLSVALGIACLQVHLSNGWFVAYNREGRQGYPVAAGLALLFGLVMIFVDMLAVLPEGINVAFPRSLLFYPAIGFFVEIVFHLFPLTVLLGVLTRASGKWKFSTIVWVSILLISLAEPLYQTVPEFGRQVSPLTGTYIGIHIFFINLTQMWLFKRYDFLSMYLFRLAYYGIWHISWGWLRLQLLF